jgi:glycosyltransferase involved in cell wall biosynthesis
MRIVHTCLRYPPATGGVETYIKEIVERTQSIVREPSHTDSGDLAGGAGILNVKNSQENRSQNLVGLGSTRDVRVLTSSMRTHGPISELDPNLLLDDPMYVQRLHHSRTPIFSYPRLQALSYYIGHHKPDILESYSFWYQPADITARYARRHNIPFIFHPVYYDRQKPTWKIYQHTLGKKTFAAADVVAVISPFEQKLIERAGMPVKRFELIPPGIDTEKFSQLRPNPFLKLGLTGKILLAVNRLAAGKGLPELIDAFRSIKQQHLDTHLVIIGEDFGERQKLETQVHQLGLEKFVHFTGRVEDHELVEWYQHAEIFVHPSHYEAFGIVIAEALAAGTPVVARNVAAIPFVSPHMQTGLLFTTPAELIRNISTLLENNHLRQQLGSAGLAHVRQNFTWDRPIKKLLSLYVELTRKLKSPHSLPFRHRKFSDAVAHHRGNQKSSSRLAHYCLGRSTRHTHTGEVLPIY